MLRCPDKVTTSDRLLCSFVALFCFFIALSRVQVLPFFVCATASALITRSASTQQPLHRAQTFKVIRQPDLRPANCEPRLCRRCDSRHAACPIQPSPCEYRDSTGPTLGQNQEP